MKNFLCPIAAVIALSLAGCNRKSQSVDKDAVEREVTARVQNQLAIERQAEEKAKLDERERQITEREQAIAERESRPPIETTERSAAAEPVQEGAAAAPQTVPTQSYDLFYKALDADGDWIETDNYGYVWRPNVATRDPAWRPYTNGHWASTDYGWAWISDEPFGWATYHFGRWTRLRGLGWVWVPGDDWAPAWVSWRSGDDYVGWAPLPPEARDDAGEIGVWADSSFGLDAVQYVFVAVPEFCAPAIQRVVLSPQQNIVVINKTVNITNISIKNRVVINRGPKVEVIKNRSKHPVTQLTVDRTPVASQRPGQSIVQGNRLQISAPLIQPSVAKPARIKARVSNAQRESSPASPQISIQAIATPNQNRPVLPAPSSTVAATPASAVVIPNPQTLTPQQLRNQQFLRQQQLELQRRKQLETARPNVQPQPPVSPVPSRVERSEQQVQPIEKIPQPNATEQIRTRQLQLQQIQTQRAAAAQRARQESEAAREAPVPRQNAVQPQPQPVKEQPKAHRPNPAVSGVPAVTP
jgi:hypothetical protein